MDKIKNIHMMGIGGSGMAGVAFLAEKMGYKVTGCDIEESTAYAKNIFKGHSPKHLKDIDLLVITPAILFQNSENPEYLEAKKRGIVMTWEEFLGKILLKNKKVIAIAGTHGKSTTTAMAGKMLIDAGLDPIVVVGAYVPEWQGNARFGKGEYAVVEADEFNNSYLNYHPDIEIINNIEFDHPDFFKDENEVRESFNKFIANLKNGGTLITSEDSPQKRFNLKVFGEHNQKNANMVYILGRKLGISDEEIVRSLESFKGIERRMQLIADCGGIKVYDDYAHHPTAIKTTIDGVRNEYPKSKILVIDEPHGYKRTKALLPEYKGVFDSADKVIIGPIFQARDEIDPSVSPRTVADASNHDNIFAFSTFEDLFRNLKLEIRNCDYNLIVVMGAGKSYLWAKEVASIVPVSFSDLTTFKVGGKIENYFEVKTKEEIDKAIDFANAKKLSIFILGDGSDILVSDKSFNGVVIKYIKKGFEIKHGNRTELTGHAGSNWDEMVAFAVDNNLGGLETLSGIPGTLGAAPVQNIGAYGAEIKDTFKSLTAYDLKEKKEVVFNKDDCKFGYRESIFKTKDCWQRYLIMNVTFELTEGASAKINYESLKGIISENATIKEVREAVLKVRESKLEDPKIHGNAGSFFKNPVIDSEKKNDLIKNFPDAKVFPFENEYKVSAAWLIEKAGLKGKEYGGAAVSPKHSLILINKTGKATSKEIYDLSQLVINEVKKKFGIVLEREVQLINFN